ncbi:MAG: prolyl oligopeptidase family serine peptidase, partial [Acidobacteria bacterium]|nr:prolyl oligopeptidase family serine peptidase [Acidobacteriota bacterium]
FFLHDDEGSELLVIDHNPAPALQSLELAPLKLLRIPDSDGFEMESMLIEPTSLEEGKRYPVYQYIYGGPHAPRVTDRWSPGSSTKRHFFHQFLAQNGIGVWIVDNRTASGKGAVATRDVYRRFGETEMEDINDGMEWLRRLAWVDPERIMISGWSYGGFMTLYAMTRSEHYVAGIAGGPVTDWRDYDTIYTERYMGLPSDNADAYETSSPRFAAGAIHGKVLLIHGTIDDNVHMQNTMQMALALQKAGKDFEMMLYPESRHSITDDQLQAHLYQTMWRFVREELLEESENCEVKDVKAGQVATPQPASRAILLASP